MANNDSQVIFDSGLLTNGGKSCQLLVYWLPNIGDTPSYQAVGYIQIEVEYEQETIFTVLFNDEIGAQQNEIPILHELILHEENKGVVIKGYLPNSKKDLNLVSRSNLFEAKSIHFSVQRARQNNHDAKRNKRLALRLYKGFND